MIKKIKNNVFNITKSYSNNGIYYGNTSFIKNVKQIDVSSFWPMIAYNLGFLNDEMQNKFLLKINKQVSDIEIDSIKKELVIYIGKLDEEKRKEINDNAIKFMIYFIKELENNKIKIVNIINDGLIVEDKENKSLSIINELESKYKNNHLKFHYDEYQYGLILNSQEYLLFDYDENNQIFCNFKNKISNQKIDNQFMYFLCCLTNKKIKGVYKMSLENVRKNLINMLTNNKYDLIDSNKILKYVKIEEIEYKGNRLSQKDILEMKKMLENAYFKIDDKYYKLIEKEGEDLIFCSNNFDLTLKCKLYNDFNKVKTKKEIYCFNLLFKEVKDKRFFKKLVAEEYVKCLEKNHIANDDLSILEYNITNECSFLVYAYLKNKKMNEKEINKNIDDISENIFSLREKLTVKYIDNSIEKSSNLFLNNNEYVFYDFKNDKWSNDIDFWISDNFLSNIDDIKNFNKTEKEIKNFTIKRLNRLKNNANFKKVRTIEETGFLDKNNNLYVFENGELIEKICPFDGYTRKKYDIDMDNVLKPDAEFDKKIDLLLNQVCNQDEKIKDSIITYFASSMLPNKYIELKKKLNNVLMVNGVAHSAKSTLFNLFSEILGDSCKHLSDIKLDDNTLNMINEIDLILFDDIPEFNKKGCVLNKKQASILSGLVNGDELIYKKLYDDKATTNFLIYPIIINNYQIIINNENIKRRNIQFSVNNTIEENKEYLENVSGSDLNNPRMKDALFRILLKREQELISNIDSIENMTKNEVNDKIFNKNYLNEKMNIENTSSIQMMLDDLEIPSIDFLYGVKRKDLFKLYKEEYFGRKELAAFEEEICNINNCEFRLKKFTAKNKETFTKKSVLCPKEKSKEKAIKEFYLKWSNFFDSKNKIKEMDIMSISELFKLMNNSNNNEFNDDVKSFC